jgi:hypothetical protein
MNSFDLYTILKKIPFLKIGQVEYLDELKDALAKLEPREFYPFTTASKTLGTVKFGLDVLSIYDFNDQSTSGNTSTTILNNKGTMNLWQPCVPTDIAQEFTVLDRAVTDFLDHPSRCRLSRLGVGKEVLWHAHDYLHKNSLLTEIILHLPIQTENVKARVRDPRTNKIYETEFKEGEVWYLNTWLPHSFKNQGTKDRYHIWYNAYLNNGEKQQLNSRLQQMFTNVVSQYEGIYID